MDRCEHFIAAHLRCTLEKGHRGPHHVQWTKPEERNPHLATVGFDWVTPEGSDKETR